MAFKADLMSDFLKPFVCLAITLLCIGKQLYADTFVVTSNADSGPGTLREAITQANSNGSGTTDYITFNITDLSVPGRTIMLVSALPPLSSNIVIDASTQPGASFGVSNTKIHIASNASGDYSQCFVMKNVSGIEIYGFYFTNFRYAHFDNYIVRCAIWMEGAVKDVQIGDVGKGNVFFNNGTAVSTAFGSSEGNQVTNLVIKSNFINLDIDGETYTEWDVGNGISILSFNNILIEGNYFAGINGDALVIITDKETGNGIVTIKNNSFGSNFNKTKAIPCGGLKVFGEFFQPSLAADISINIIGNSFRNPVLNFTTHCRGVIGLTKLSGYITIKGNTIGSPDLFFQDCQGSGIVISECNDGIIGGENPEDQNIIQSNSNSAIGLYDNKNITIQKNSIVCNFIGITAQSAYVDIPEIKLLESNNVDFVAGTATPNCIIEVFQNLKECEQCNNGEIYLGSTTSDANGKWSFTHPFSGAVTARATSASGVSGEFTHVVIHPPVDIAHPVCGGNNGHIKGVHSETGTRFYWLRVINGEVDTIHNTYDLIDVGPGHYTFVVEQTKYCKVVQEVSLENKTPKISGTPSLANPHCGQPNGGISNMSPDGYYDKIYWLSDLRDTVGVYTDLFDAPEGRYKLIIMNEKTGCGDSTAYFTLRNQSGPTLDYSGIHIDPATCNTGGSISGIRVRNDVGNIHVEWVDSLGYAVEYSFNLRDQPPGKYFLRYKDDSGCDTIISPPFTISSVGMINIDTTGITVMPAGCEMENGSIKNILISGATTLEWRNTNNHIVSTQTNATGLPSGDYILFASNADGCTANSPAITIPTATFANISPINPVAVNAACGQNNGTINIDGFTNPETLHSYQWTNTITNEIISTTYSASALGEGNYALNVVDINGCKKVIYSTEIKANAKPRVNVSNILIQNDKCGESQGSITGIRLEGLSNIPSYIWTNEAGIEVATTLNLTNVEAGKYQLKALDGLFCSVSSDLITINNDNTTAPPLYQDAIIPKNTSTTLKPSNPSDGSYTLYADSDGSQKLMENTTGIFETSSLDRDHTFYVQFKRGNCISGLVPVKISVVDQSIFLIPNAFSPNGDNLNDVLNVKVSGYIKLEYFRIFNRFGNQVFFTNEMGKGWDGRLNGLEQPTGNYIWTARGIDLLGKVIESKGTVTLIR